MSRLACEARKARCDEADAERIRNPVSECRECEGWASMKKKLVTKDHKPRQQAPEVAGYHMGEKTKHQKFPCQCCGANVWLSGAYCTSCHSQFGFAAEHGIGREQAIQVVQQFYADGGVRPHRGGKNNRAKYLIDWVKIKEMSKKGTCGCCGRDQMSLTGRKDEKWVCGTCYARISKGETFVTVQKYMQAKFAMKQEPKQEDKLPADAGKKVEKPEDPGLHNSIPEPQKTPPKSATRKRGLRLQISERDEKIIEWVDQAAKQARRTRNDQIMVILEEAMEREAA